MTDDGRDVGEDAGGTGAEEGSDKTPESTEPKAEGANGSGFGWKDAALGILALAVLVLGGIVLRDHTEAGPKPGAGDADAVAVFDIDFDREQRRYLEILFDQPLGETKIGEVLEQPPATLDPSLGGVWTWRDTHALRFEPTGRFQPATRYRVSLIPDRLDLGELRFAGDTELTVTTDPFLVERVDTTEEPALEGNTRNGVIFQGTIQFNYAVDPEELAPLIRLEDPASGEPLKVELQTGWRTQGIAFRTQPIEKRPQERTAELTIDGSLTPADGNLALVEGSEFRHPLQVGSSERLAIRSLSVEAGRPDSRITMTLSSPVEPSLVSRYLTLEPVGGAGPAGGVRFRLSGARNQVIASGPFEPGKKYKLTLGKGMPSLDDAVLQEAYTAEVAVPNLSPSLDFASDGMFLSRSGSHRMAIESVNVSNAKLTVDRIFLNNLFVVFRYQGFSVGESGYVQTWLDSRVGDRLVSSESLDLAGARNQPAVTRFDLDDHVRLPERGLFRITVQRGNGYDGAQRWLLLTDLGVIAKRGDNGLDVWVSSFKDLSTVTGARVRLISDQNQEMATATTDGSGRVSLPAPPPTSYDSPRPYYLTVEKGDDFTFLLLDAMQVDTSGLDVGGAPVGAQGYRAFLYGERDLYRPGETVEGVAVLRDETLQAPPQMPVLLRHRDPQGRLRDEWSLTTSRAGLAELSLELPPYAVTGGHGIEVLAGGEIIGNWRFQVEEFVPDRIKVEIRTQPGKTGEAARVGPGDELSWEVTSNYLFGPPAAGLPVETRARLVDDTFAPEGWQGWSFRNTERELDDREILVREESLGDAGTATFAAMVPSGASVPSSLSAVITARVRETGGRGVTARTRLRVDPYPYYLGLKAPESYAEPGEPVRLSWVALSPKGEETKAGALRADFYRERWNTVLRRTPAGTYRYETTRELELVDSKPVNSTSVNGGAARGEIEVVPPEFGSYKLVVLDPQTAASASVSFYASGWGFAPWALENPALVELDLEKEEYRPGETAVVQVRAPFPGRLLLTVERGRVLYSQVHTLDGNTARLEVPVNGAWRPNVYLTATLVRSASDLVPGEPGRAFGAVPLAVDRTSNRLAVEIDAPKEIRPETRLSVTVKGAPGAEVTVAAVDEGILQLIAQRTPDPFSFFYRKLALAVTTYDLFALLLPELEDGASAGGGEGEEAMAQYVGTQGIRRVEPVAFWSGVLEAGADGRVTATFDVPRFQGALRVMAVALDGRTFGSAQETVRVRDPLVLLPTAPRVLATGDRTELPVTVRNDTGKEGAIEVVFEATGAASPDGETKKTVQLASGRETTVYFAAKAADDVGGASALATFRFRASGLSEQTKAEERVPVRPALPPVRTEDAGAVREASLDLPAVPDGQYRKGTVTRDIHFGPVPLVSFSGHLENLLRYPYGCLEQTVSRAFPLIYLDDLAKRLDPELFEKTDPEAYVQAGIDRVTDLQVHGGGFALWPGSDAVYAWGTVYASHFLVEAQRAGYPVDTFVLDGALGYLAGESKAQGSYGSEQLDRLAYGLYVLARADRAEMGTMDFLRERQKTRMSRSARALLAAAYAQIGDPQASQELAEGIDDADRVARQTGGNLASTLRNRALLLLALLDAVPNDPRIPDLAERLAREGRTVTRWTTQETAWVFLALGELFQRQDEKAEYDGTLSVGGKKIADFGHEPVVFRNVGSGPIQVRMRSGYEANAAYYSLVTRGIPTDQAFQPRNEGLEIERTVLTREGQPVNSGAIRQGDLLVVKTRVRSVSGPVENVVVENLLPSGLEVENPRLSTTETLPWVTDANAAPAYLDLRDDRILMFLDLPADTWQTTYALVRAVTPGSFRMPPPHAEAMYDPALSATGPVGEMVVQVK